MLPSSNRLGCSERKVQLTSNLLYDFCISKCVQMCRREVEALLLAKLQQLVLHLTIQTPNQFPVILEFQIRVRTWKRQVTGRLCNWIVQLSEHLCWGIPSVLGMFRKGFVGLVQRHLVLLCFLTRVSCGCFNQLEKMNLKGPLTSIRSVNWGTEGSCEKLMFAVRGILKGRRRGGNFVHKSWSPSILV